MRTRKTSVYYVMFDKLYIEEDKYPTKLVILDMIEIDIILGIYSKLIGRFPS